ncbi:MAG: DUF504 domain-containing protein [Myxococcales bacterium]|nr:DUF504 domain-containing protein [Myxococcales bacterium]
MARRNDKTALRTSRQVIDQIRWDPALDERAFTVGYEERFDGLTEIPLVEFPTDGSIPWHRVWHVRVEALTVWSRRDRVDLLHGTGDSLAPDTDTVLAAIARQRAAAELPTAPRRAARTRKRPRRPLDVDAIELEPRAVYRHDAARGRWIARAPEAAAPAPCPTALTLVTLNVLFDLYQPERIHTARRTPALLDALRELNADIIALQEVTPRLLAILLDTPWIQRDYWVSETEGASSAGADAAGSTVHPYGQLLLSRLPTRLHVARLNGHKRVVIGELELAGRLLITPIVHLTSSRAEGAAEVRARELEVALTLVDRVARERAHACVLLGDFNARDDALAAQLAARGFTDLWTEHNPDDPGMTFDPRVNGLAAITSLSQRPGRLDRVYARLTGEAPEWLSPVDITMIATAPIDAPPEHSGLPLYPSDHFGLCALLQVEPVEPQAALSPALRDAEPVHRSALAIIPPPEIWPSIQAIRARHDPSHSRWPPHLNLLYGFVPEPLLAEAADALRRALADAPPFTISLEEFSTFRARRGVTVWLAPRCDPPDALRRLHATLAALFPRCDEHGRRSRAGFTPHLTVARLDSGEDVEATIQRWRAGWQPPRFTVDALALISRRDDEPFELRHEVALARPPAPAAPEPSAPAPPARELDALLEDLERACVACIHGAEAPPDVRHVHLIGSHRLGVATANSDVDVVCVGPSWFPRARLFARLPERLAALGRDVQHRVVDQARTPRLELRVDGEPVDVQYIRTPAGTPIAAPRELPPSARAALDDVSARSLLATLDVDELLARARDFSPGGLEGFRATLRLVRRWARARDVDANALGYPGGLAWAIILLEAAPRAPPVHLLTSKLDARRSFADFLRARAGAIAARPDLARARRSRRAGWGLRRQRGRARRR